MKVKYDQLAPILHSVEKGYRLNAQRCSEEEAVNVAEIQALNFELETGQLEDINDSVLESALAASRTLAKEYGLTISPGGHWYQLANEGLEKLFAEPCA